MDAFDRWRIVLKTFFQLICSMAYFCVVDYVNWLLGFSIECMWKSKEKLKSLHFGANKIVEISKSLRPFTVGNIGG